MLTPVPRDKIPEKRYGNSPNYDFYAESVEEFLKMDCDCVKVTDPPAPERGFRSLRSSASQAVKRYGKSRIHLRTDGKDLYLVRNKRTIP